jgi:hypothetical protein
MKRAAGLLLAAFPLSAQPPRSFLHQAFGGVFRDEQPLPGPLAPGGGRPAVRLLERKVNAMNAGRRRLLAALALAHGCRRAPDSPPTKITVDTLRDVSTVHGTNLGDARLQIIRPALERRFSELRALRDFEIDEAVGPAQGILME